MLENNCEPVRGSCGSSICGVAANVVVVGSVVHANEVKGWNARRYGESRSETIPSATLKFVDSKD